LLSQLSVKSQQTTTLLTALNSLRQQSIYLPKEELGRDNFDTIYKIVDVSTNYEYVVKMFHDDDCKKKIEILKSVLHVSVIIGT
jgi:serine/threonine protein kinase